MDFRLAVEVENAESPSTRPRTVWQADDMGRRARCYADDVTLLAPDLDSTLRRAKQLALQANSLLRSCSFDCVTLCFRFSLLLCAYFF